MNYRRALFFLFALGFHVAFGDSAAAESAATNAFLGSKPGSEKSIVGIRLCWCPPGKFIMGSPPTEPERRPDEDQVEVTLTKGFWMGKYEATQGQWKRIVGDVGDKLTAELPADPDYPIGNVSFADAERFCQNI